LPLAAASDEQKSLHRTKATVAPVLVDQKLQARLAAERPNVYSTGFEKLVRAPAERNREAEIRTCRWYRSFRK
jgi:hypothetical protein